MTTSEFKIYLDSDTCQFHVNQFSVELEPESISRNVDGFLFGSARYRVAAFHVYFQGSEWIDRLHQIYDHCDKIFVFCTELHEHTVAALKTLDLPKIVLYISGHINDYQFQHATVKPYMDWFVTTGYFYLYTRPDFLNEKLQPFQIKAKSFDILLGNTRTHRNFVHDYVSQRKSLEQNVLMTYVKNGDQNLLTNEEFIFDQTGIEFINNDVINHSVGYVRYYGTPMSISQIVPINIYQKTAYSLVAETNALNSFNFYTEKIVKPILARRLFVVVSGQHYLKNLRRLGFKTFDRIIDESYDNAEDNETRWRMAMEQVEWLTQQDQQTILDRIRPIAEFNLEVIKSRAWYQEVIEDFERRLNQ
jgi:hypothetical protein